jgi:hypothetical protein
MSRVDRKAAETLLARDVASTLGAEQQSHIDDFIRSARRYVDPSDPWYTQRVVDDVQQYFHDTHLHTTWPPCPRHVNHPLWYKDGWWWCERDQMRIVKLGDLSALKGEQ